MEAPVAAPRGARLGARAKSPRPLEAPGPQPPRRKKKSAPGPPGHPSAGGSTSSLLPPRNSTMHSSMASLASTAEFSPIRHAASVTSLNTGRKKRRAPAPPPPHYSTLTPPSSAAILEAREERGAGWHREEEGVRGEEDMGKEEDLRRMNTETEREREKQERRERRTREKREGKEKKEEGDKRVQEFYENPLSTKVEERLVDMSEDRTLVQESKVQEISLGGEVNTLEPKVINTEVIEEDKVEERKVEDDVMGEQFNRTHETVLITDLGAPENHEEEHRERRKKKKKDKYMDRSDDDEGDEHKKKKKKKHKHHRDESEHTEKRKKHKHHRHRDKDTEVESEKKEKAAAAVVDSVMTAPDVLERVENPSPILITKEDHVDKNAPVEDEEALPDQGILEETTEKTLSPDLSQDEEDEDNDATWAEEDQRRKDRKERRRSKKKEVVAVQAQEDRVEVPSFRGARLGKSQAEEEEVGAKDSSLPVCDSKSDSDDSLVDSDDELVDLFSMSGRKRGVKKGASQELGNTWEPPSSVGPGGQDSDPEEKPRRITGKEREEEMKEQIRSEQRQGRKRSEVEVGQQGSESVRRALTQLNLGGMEAEAPPAYKREWKAVQLEIEEEDMGLPSMNSSRSNSVVELSSDEESREVAKQHSEFAMKDLEKQVVTQRVPPVNPEISKALDESFAVMSMTPEQDDSYVTVADTVVVGKSPSPEPPILCEAKNLHMASHDMEFSEPEESSSVGDGEPPPDAVRPREAPTLTQAPSPDSGIHDYGGEQCASPVSSLGLCRELEDASADKQGGPSTPDSGLELHGSVSEVTSSSGADTCLQDVAEEDEDMPESLVVERVELPRRHTGKVLFSMTSYNERSHNLVAPPPAPRDVVRTESYRRVSSQLNSSLAAGVEKAREAERRASEDAAVKAWDAEKKAREEQEQRNKEVDEQKKIHEELELQRTINRQRADEGDRKRLEIRQRKQREEEEALRMAEDLERRYRRKDMEPVSRAASFPSQPNSSSFRSRIIEQFEERRGVVIVGSEHGPAGGAPARCQAPQPPQSADGGAADRAPPSDPVTRSLDRREMPSWSGGEFASLQRGLAGASTKEAGPRSFVPRGPPSISMQVWGEEPRTGEVVVKEHRDTVQSRRVSPPPAVEVVTSTGRGGTGTTRTGHTDATRTQSRPVNAQRPIEIRHRSGEVEVMDDPRTAVLSAAKQSRATGGDDSGKQGTVWGPRVQVTSV